MGSTKIGGVTYPESTDQPLVSSHLRQALEEMGRMAVPRFANAAERNAAFTSLGISPTPGMLCYLADVDRYYRYRPTAPAAWVPFGYLISALNASGDTTTSTAYADMSVAGPAVSVETGTTAKVTITSLLYNSGSNVTLMSFAVSGATTIAADDQRSLQHALTSGVRASLVSVVTTLTPGTNVFTAKYRVAAGTGNFFYREISVEPM